MSFKSLSIVAAAAMALGSVGAQAANSYLANGGFESPGDGVGGAKAANWLGSPSYDSQDCTVAHSGSCSLQLSSAALQADGAEQNNTKDGGKPELNLGDVVTMSFYAKGFQGSTGDFKARLAYLDGGGAIQYDSQFLNFNSQLKSDSWTQMFITGAAVGQAGLSAFVQFIQPIGPIGTGPAGENWLAGQVWVDDVSVVPEPGSYALMLAGLGVIGTIVRRRRQA